MTKEGKVTSNKEIVESIIDSTGREVVKMLAMMMESCGVKLSILDPDQVRVYNEMIRFAGETKEQLISWAEHQDNVNNKNKIMQQTMAGMIEKQREMLIEQHDLLNKIYAELEASKIASSKKGGDRS